MSDDTPTQRFPESGGDTPTERIGAETPAEDLREEKQKSRGLLIALIIAGALLLIALIVLLILLFGSKQQGGPDAGPSDSPSASATPSATPSESPTPSATPTPEPTQAPPPPPSNPTPVVNSFSTGTATVWCGTASDPDPEVDLNISWSTSNGNRVYFGVDTNDASTAPFFDNLPLSGNSGSNFPSGYVPFQFACGSETHKYTLTVVDGQGHKASKSVTVKDLSYALNN